MERLVLAAALVVVAVVVAALLRRRAATAPTRPREWPVPSRVDRADFARPEAPWLVAVFSSATCQSCADTVRKATVLESGEVVVADVEAGTHPEIHRRYGIEAVPLVVVADADGVVRASFVGPPTATDLWAAVAEVREPGSTPESQCDRSDRGGAPPVR
ncbi:MAG: hypothetical protein IPM45_15150 [Acidimicrobiales bacterium]|nr:hypothetical protein [Acidimicrobiales bacterium]